MPWHPTTRSKHLAKTPLALRTVSMLLLSTLAISITKTTSQGNLSSSCCMPVMLSIQGSQLFQFYPRNPRRQPSDGSIFLQITWPGSRHCSQKHLSKKVPVTWRASRRLNGPSATSIEDSRFTHTLCDHCVRAHRVHRSTTTIQIFLMVPIRYHRSW